MAVRRPSPPLPPVTSATAPLSSVSLLLTRTTRSSLNDQGAQVSAQCLARLAEDHLGHEDDGQLFFRIDPERGPGSTAPEILAERAWQAGLGYIDGDGAAERKATSAT